MKYYIIAGEASGDLHASNLIKAIKERDPEANFRGFGGDLMEQAGLRLRFHYKEIAFMGFYEVARNLGTLLKAMKLCKTDIKQFQPDAIIFVDFAGFNLRMAKWAKAEGFKTLYYISPKIWAWNTKRVLKIKQYIDKMYVILPFEKEFYANFGFDVDYVGNPLHDAIRAFEPNPSFRADNNLDSRPIIAVLPGSRRQEIEHMLHYMVSIIPPFMEHYQFVVAGMTSMPKEYYEKFRRHDTIRIVYGQTYDILHNAHAAVVTSGTATLETALFNVPEVVCYKSTLITYLIARAVIKVKFISLVNLIAGREVVKELIQDNFIPSNLNKELRKVVDIGADRDRVLKDYAELKAIMGDTLTSATTADLMLKYLRK